MLKVFQCSSCRKFFDSNNISLCPYCGEDTVTEYKQSSSNKLDASTLNKIAEQEKDEMDERRAWINKFQIEQSCTFQFFNERDNTIESSILCALTQRGFDDGGILANRCNIEKCPFFKILRKLE